MACSRVTPSLCRGGRGTPGYSRHGQENLVGAVCDVDSGFIGASSLVVAAAIVAKRTADARTTSSSPETWRRNPSAISIFVKARSGARPPQDGRV